MTRKFTKLREQLADQGADPPGADPAAEPPPPLPPARGMEIEAAALGRGLGDGGWVAADFSPAAAAAALGRGIGSPAAANAGGLEIKDPGLQLTGGHRSRRRPRGWASSPPAIAAPAPAAAVTVASRISAVMVQNNVSRTTRPATCSP